MAVEVVTRYDQHLLTRDVDVLQREPGSGTGCEFASSQGEALQQSAGAVDAGHRDRSQTRALWVGAGACEGLACRTLEGSFALARQAAAPGSGGRLTIAPGAVSCFFSLTE